MKNTKFKKVYAFIDSQNLNLGIKSCGWDLDWRKFRQYLRDKYSVSKAYLFIGHKPGNESLYLQLQEYGFLLILKPTMEFERNGKVVVKGNVDAELVLHAMIHFETYDKALIISGDGDFYCLVEHLFEKEKLLRLMVPNRKYSGLLRKFNHYVTRVDLLRPRLEFRKK